MRRKSPVFKLLVAGILLTPFLVAAMSGTMKVAFEGQPVSADADWPQGVAELVNDPLRTVGLNPYFSEWPNDVNHYLFKAQKMEDINQLLQKLSAIKAPKVQLLLNPEPEPSSLGFTTRLDKSNAVAAVFSLGSQARLNEWYGRLEQIEPGTRKFGVHRLSKPPEAHPPTLTLYVGHKLVDLKKLVIPSSVLVVADVATTYKQVQKADPLIKQIEQFVAEVESKKKTR